MMENTNQTNAAKIEKLPLTCIICPMGCSMEVEVETDEKVALNSRYLLDALNATKDSKISFGISSKLEPVVIRNAQSDDYTHIIMPLKS